MGRRTQKRKMVGFEKLSSTTFPQTRARHSACIRFPLSTKPAEKFVQRRGGAILRATGIPGTRYGLQGSSCGTDLAPAPHFLLLLRHLAPSRVRGLHDRPLRRQRNTRNRETAIVQGRVDQGPFTSRYKRRERSNSRGDTAERFFFKNHACYDPNT